MNRYLLTLILLCLIFESFNAQQPAVFVDESWRIENSISSDYSIAVSDINGDYRDDIVRMNSDSIYFTLNIAQTNRFRDFSVLPKSFPILSTNIADLDNDHHNEILVSGNRTGVEIYDQQNNDLNFILTSSTAGDYYTQGSSVVDINGDGFLDYFIANDIGNNQVYINDRAGGLTSTVIDDFNVLSAQGTSGNYNASWLDADNDGDLDLYIAKCHINANSFDDPRRINQFFENRNGVYIERSSDLNLDLGDQSWCSSIGDLDNDGDPDIVLINHGTPIMILENQNDNGFITHSDFTEEGEIIGDEQQLIIQDFNNDGLLDILILGFNDRLLLNRGNLQFANYNNPIGGGNAYSGASGDFNNDGWMDIYAIYGTADSGVDDKMWMNFKLQNHYIKFSLNGLESNAQAIGSQLVIYGEWGSQRRWLISGDSYGITNSMNLHFGLASHSIVDSMHCIWPSGHIDRFYQLDVDQHYVISESECIAKLGEVQSLDSGVLCEGDSLLLYANEIEEVIWNSSIIEDTLLVELPGYYFAESSSSCKNASGIIEVDTSPELEGNPILYAGDVIELCQGDQLELYSDSTYAWNTSDSYIGDALTVSQDGIYFCYVANACDTIQSHEVNVVFHVIDTSSVYDTITPTEEYWLKSGFSESEWYDDKMNFLLKSDSLLITDVYADTLFYFSYSKPRSFDAFDAGPEFIMDNSALHADTIMDKLTAVVFNEIKLISLDVFTETEGERKLIVMTPTNDTLYRETYYLDKGRNTLLLNFDLSTGEYVFSFDVETNVNILGSVSPKLMSNSSNQVNYPFSLGQYLELVEDDLGQTNNLYFYNWHIQPLLEDCNSGLIAYELEVDTSVGIQELVQENFMVYPNPTDHSISLYVNDENTVVMIFDFLGRKLYKSELSRGQNDILVDQLKSGVYNILLLNDKVMRSGQFVKQ